MENMWWLYSQVVYDAMMGIIQGTPDADPLINSAVSKFGSTDGLTHSHMFKTIDRATVTWYLGNVYNLTAEEIDALQAKWPTDMELGGLWNAETGERLGELHPDLIQFMPDVCMARDADSNCTDVQPATELTDVVLMMGQPGRQFT